MRRNVEEVYAWIVDNVIEESHGVLAQEGIDSSFLDELRESWSRRLKESGAMGNGHHYDEHEWMTEKTERVAKHSKMPQTTFNTSHMNQESNSRQTRVAIGVPHKTAESTYSRACIPRDMHMWPHNHAMYTFPVGSGAVMARHPTPVISSQATRPMRRSTGVMDSALLHNSLYAGTERPSNIRVVANDPAWHLHHEPALMTSPVPQVRSSLKRKEGVDGPASLTSHSGSARSVRRKSGDDKTSSIIPQSDGGADEPLTSPRQSETQEEPDLDDDSTLSDGDDEEELIESSNCLTAQYDKVSRIKNRWRCVLKHGIFHIDGRDVLFKSANGEFTF